MCSLVVRLSFIWKNGSRILCFPLGVNSWGSNGSMYKEAFDLLPAALERPRIPSSFKALFLKFFGALVGLPADLDLPGRSRGGLPAPPPYCASLLLVNLENRF